MQPTISSTTKDMFTTTYDKEKRQIAPTKSMRAIKNVAHFF